MIRVSVIICTYNRAETLKKTLIRLDCVYVPPEISIQILVVDNNSSDNTKAVVDEYILHSKFDVRYIFENNQGKSYALNRGINEAKGDIIVFTDDDILVRHDWIKNIKKAFDETGCSCVGGKILLHFEKSPPDWLGDKMMEQLGLDLGDAPLVLKRPFVYGANCAVSKSVFGKYGNFDVSLGPKGDKMHHSEDICFVEKLICGGEKVLYSPDIVVEHMIPSQHLEKSYFRKRAYYQAETSGIGGIIKKSKNIAGIPLFIFKDAIVTGFKCVFDRNSSSVDSFNREIHFAQLMGFIIGRLKYKKFK